MEVWEAIARASELLAQRIVLSGTIISDGAAVWLADAEDDEGARERSILLPVRDALSVLPPEGILIAGMYPYVIDGAAAGILTRSEEGEFAGRLKDLSTLCVYVGGEARIVTLNVGDHIDGIDGQP